ncbi:hypothetical protein AYI70_g3170 [Smittium culicis]|uniref:Uncharacterized protein n=1 Tax=Smittium culicis TaxID=133412 RepID=A0A1R1Y4Q2_9FUNG|nr:hypothetical protein AYI70_g3170 [Smittium culicis]
MHDNKMYIKYGEYGYMGIDPEDESAGQDLVIVRDFGANCVYLELTPIKSVFRIKLNSKVYHLCYYHHIHGV